ncbi:MAG: hypothetical protein AB1758_21405, partial [Candidatus Eremiobacterota bacterium]
EILAGCTPEERRTYDRRIQQALGARDGLGRLDRENRGGRWDVFGEDDPAEQLDRTAAALTARGFRVVRVPYLGLPQSTLGQAEDPLPFVTYNNVLMESEGDRRVVHLPRYGLDRLDQAAQDAYRSLGFEVRSVGDPIRVKRREVYPMLVVSARKGALRCLSQVLDRGT